MSFWNQALEIARVDLLVETRSGEMIKIVAPFAVVTLMVFPLALGTQLSIISQVGLGIFWALAVLFGMQVALRRSATDSAGRRDAQLLLGIDPAARFVGRLLSGGLLMIVFLGVLLIAVATLLAPDVPTGGWPIVILASVLLAVGLTELSTLAGEVTAGLRNRSTLAPLIVAPMALPLVIGASQSVQALQRDTGILTWILLLIATDLALAVAGVALAGPLEEATR